MIGARFDPFASATTMLRALRDRRVSALELLEFHVKHIERYNPSINAIVTSNSLGVRESAAQADEVRARGADQDLLGLPVTVKDTIDMAGLRGTAGVQDFAWRVPEADAPLIARIKAAGAAILGKTNVPPYAGDWQASNPVFGRTNNPWDLSRTPGGSTGGGAAAVAAGMTPLEFGSDLAGSIRVPAVFCGVYGHKPSESVCPRTGHFPGSPLPNTAVSLSTQGPLARSAFDLELALDVIAGPEADDSAAWRLQIPRARHKRLSEFRVAVLPRFDWLPLDDELAAALEGLADQLGRLGSTVEEILPATFGDLREFYATYESILLAIVTSEQPYEERRRIATDLIASGDEVAAAAARGMLATATDYIGWHAQRARYRAAYQDFFRRWDVLLAPVTMGPAFPHIDDFSAGPWLDRTIDVNGKPVSYNLMSAYPSLATLCGLPATAFPVGLNQHGLPLGLQAIGPYLEDRTTLQFAQLLEQQFGGFQPPPNYAT